MHRGAFYTLPEAMDWRLFKSIPILDPLQSLTSQARDHHWKLRRWWLIFNCFCNPTGQSAWELEPQTLYRVNFEVNKLKPFPHLAFPHFSTPENRSKKLGFNGELMASSPPTFRPSHGIVPDCRPTYNLTRLAWLCVIDPRFTQFSALN